MDTKSDRLSDDLLAMLRRDADGLRAGMVKFAQDLIAMPSLPGQEKDVADRVVQEMKALGYDDVQVDATGNVIGMSLARARRADYQSYNGNQGFRKSSTYSRKNAAKHTFVKVKFLAEPLYAVCEYVTSNQNYDQADNQHDP